MAKKRINSRTKGHNFERAIVKKLNKLTIFKNEITTSRYSSRITDDKKIDIFGTEKINIQAKHIETFSVNNIYDTLNDMDDFNPEDDKINTLFYKKNRKGVLVIIREEDYYTMLKKYIKEDD